MVKATQAGMGAIPGSGLTTFRVWAPHAGSVRVAGKFNNWSDTASPLSQEGNGYWAADVAGAKVGDEYKFVIINRDTGAELWKNDPYARQLTSDKSQVNSVIAKPNYTWSTTGYAAPAWNEMVIYDLARFDWSDSDWSGVLPDDPTPSLVSSSEGSRSGDFSPLIYRELEMT